MDHLEQLEGEAFDQAFLTLMIPHHLGAVLMARREIAGGADLRVRLLAASIRHSQVGQLERMYEHVDTEHPQTWLWRYEGEVQPEENALALPGAGRAGGAAAVSGG